MSLATLDSFVSHVATGDLIPDPATLFNPWGDFDPQHDASLEAPTWRRDHLLRYLAARLDSARVLLIAEAPSYSGAKFSGIAMTSERDLIDPAVVALRPPRYFEGLPRRTSRPLAQLKNQDGMLERTASIVWKSMLENGFAANEFVLWNAVAYHPHEAGNPLSNRMPSATEMRALRPLLEQFLALFPDRPVVAVGRVCQKSMETLGIDALPARHPSYGGAPEFRAGMRALAETLDRPAS